MNLKPKKGFIQAELNTEKLTPIQWTGILRAMDAYAEHYHEYMANSSSENKNEFTISDVSQRDELLLSAICQFTKRNTQKEIQEVERWIETDYIK